MLYNKDMLYLFFSCSVTSLLQRSSTDDPHFTKHTVHLQQNMDKDLENEPTSQGWKTEQEKLPAPRQQWDSVESDTESLAQERADPQHLHMDLIRHHQHKHTLPQKKEDDSLQEGEGASDDEARGLQVVDSLDVAAKRRAKSSPTLTQTERLDTHTNERGGTR